MKHLAFALLLVAATPAPAADFPFSTFGAELESGVLEDAPELTLATSAIGPLMLQGGLRLQIDRTPMSVLTDTFDIAPQTYQRVGYTTVWVCFTDAGRRVWYTADLTYETRDDIYVSNVIDEPADPATDTIFGCKPEPKAMLAKQQVLPTIGATLADLSTLFATDIPAGTRITGGHAYSPHSEAATTYESRAAYYRLINGTVDAVSIAGGYFEDGEP